MPAKCLNGDMSAFKRRGVPVHVKKTRQVTNLKRNATAGFLYLSPMVSSAHAHAITSEQERLFHARTLADKRAAGRASRVGLLEGRK
jgi:hypothetical protein